MSDEPTLAELLERLATQPDPAVLNRLRRHPGLEVAEGDEAWRAAQVLGEHGNFGDLEAVADLAYRAHRSGVPEAGALYATATDRSRLMAGRAQTFGTITMSHQGELALAPVDRATPDQIRTELGLPTLAEIRRQVTEHNRDQARDRAAEPGRLDGQPYCRVWTDPTAAELRARWEAEGQAVWADGDVLTFVTDRPVAGALVGPLFELPMWRPADGGTDLWVLQVRVARLDEAVLTYAIWPLDDNGQPAFTRRPDPDGRYRGPNALPAPPTNETIKGTLVEHMLDSSYLGEGRQVTVYLPPGHAIGDGLYPVVYATDGQFFAPYARRVDAAIEAGTIPPLVIVASHAAGFDPARGGNLRAMEYLLGFDPRRYEAHERFFVTELARWAEAEFAVSTERDRRAVFGCSDGGGHAMTTAVFHGDRFGHVLACSAGTPPLGSERWADGAAPKIQLCAGILEPAFHGATAAWSTHLARTGVEHHFTERVSGHELLQWVEELPLALARAFA